jgi:molybdopterin-guanine dinucleotide biosynthesis protein A
MDAVILAGSPNTGKLKECSPASNEALIDIGGRYMVDYVVAALTRMPEIDKIVIVGPVAELRLLYGGEPKIRLTGSGSTPIESLKLGVAQIDWREGDSRVLVVTSDVPLITPEAIRDFLSSCGDRSADLYYPVVTRQANEQRFPGVKRTYVRLRDGVFTGGNIFLFNAGILERVAPQAEEFVRLRKKPLALCRLIGIPFILKYLLGRFTIRDAELRVCRMLQINGKAVISRYAEIGVDVDKPCDLELARKVLLSH